jgi:hypothetical protein
MSSTPVILSHDLDVNNVTFAEPKKNARGGTSVALKYASQPFQLRMPRSKFPAGLIQREDASSGNVSYSLIASLKGCDPYAKERSTDAEMGPLYNFMLDLQEKVIQWATENSPKLFGKKRSDESIRDSFKSLLSVSNDKIGDEYVPNGKYPPSLRLKIPVYDSRVTMDAVDGKMMPYHLTEDSLKSVFPKYVESNLVIAGNMYVIGQSFGLTWSIKFAQVFQPSRLTAAAIFTPEDAYIPDEVQEVNVPEQESQSDVQVDKTTVPARRRKAAPST